MVRLRRTGRDNRIIVRNSKVYASTLNRGRTNGLFAYRDLDEGEILVQYKGDLLSQKDASASNSQYLFDVLYRTQNDRIMMKTIDGQGRLMGFANHAPTNLANAYAVDLIPTIVRHSVPYDDRTALVLIAKKSIRKGTEIRFNYNIDQGDDDGPMVQQMLAQGVQPRSFLDPSFLTSRFFTPPEPQNHAGNVVRDFPYRFVHDMN